MHAPPYFTPSRAKQPTLWLDLTHTKCTVIVLQRRVLGWQGDQQLHGTNADDSLSVCSAVTSAQEHKN
jgi:hypothetical protein